MRIAELIIGDINRLTGGYLYDRKLVEYLKDNGIKVDVIGIREVPCPYILHLFSNLSLILRFGRSRSYDFVLEDEMAHPALFIFNLWLRHLRKTKIVVIVHLLWWKVAKGWKVSFVKYIEKVMLKSSDLIIVNSKHTKEEIKGMGIPDELIKVVYPGFDLPLSSVKRKESYHKGDSIKLLSVANCSPLKGLDTLIEAIQRLDNPKIKLDVVGDDNFEPGYCKRIKEKVLAGELEGKVIFHGLVDPKNLSGFYSEADIFVLPPFYESLGIVFAEAMSFGLPIIATNVGGIPELVEEDENGLLVPPGDVGALAEAIDKLASDARLRERFGRNSYEKSKKLNTWADCCEKIFQYLLQL